MTEPTGPARRLITTREAFVDALRAAFSQAAGQGCRTLSISDDDFLLWPLNEQAVIDQLTRWALPHRRFFMVARQFDEVARRHPRFVDWRRAFSHIVDCRAPEHDAAADVPTLLVAEGLVAVRLAEPAEFRGIVLSDRADLVQCRETFDAHLQRSSTAFPATTLGL